jgi:hypothetical protein
VQSFIPWIIIPSHFSRYPPGKEHKQQAMDCEPDSHLQFDSGHGRNKSIFISYPSCLAGRPSLYGLSGTFSRQGSSQTVGCCHSELRTWKSQDRIAERAHLRVAASTVNSTELRPSEISFEPFFAKYSHMQSTPPRLKVQQSSAGIAYRKLSASAVVDPAERWRSKYEAERAIRRVSARAFDVAEP